MSKELDELAARLQYLPGALEQGLAGVIRHLSKTSEEEFERGRTPAALTDEQLFAEMTRRDSSWNAYGRSRESAVRLARDVIDSMQKEAP